MSESTAEFANDVNGRIAKMLHAALHTIGRLERQIEMNEAVIKELQMHVLMRQAMLDAMATEVAS